MKKFTILALAALLVVAFTVPAAAFESQFGGYWRTRFYINKDFKGDDSGSRDWEVVDTRTRLYYTAVLNDNLKFVNKFEWNAVWGDPGSAPIGTDRTTVMRWKNSYIDANAMGLNWKIGLQGTSLGRSFLFDDDFAGAIVTYKSDMFDLPFLWIKAYDDGSYDSNTYDYDYYAINPKFKMGGVSINPFALYGMTNNAANAVYSGAGAGLPTFDRLDAWFLGLNADFNLGPAGMWFTGIYNGGTGEVPDGNDQDFQGYLLAIGGNFDLGPANVHGQIFYASGDDDPNDDKIKAFVAPKGQSYYWSEIMGYGIFDKQVSNNSPGDQVSNITAYNLGAGMKMGDKWKGTVDLWYANLTEDIVLADGSSVKDLGFEVDLVLTYQLIDGLNLDLVGAYLFAGDATTEKAGNEQDPYEIGARVSLSF